MTEEIREVDKRLDSLSLDIKEISHQLVEIKLLLSKQDGLALPVRLSALELEVDSLKIDNARNSKLPDQVETNRQDIKNLWRFTYTATGGLIVLNIIIAVLGKLFIDRIFN